MEPTRQIAAFYNQYATLHVPDSNMRKEMEEYPAPSNLVQVQRLDQWAIDELKKSGKNALIDADKDFMTIRGVWGPLGAMLQSLEMHRNGENPEELDSDTFSDQLQNSIILLAHAFEKVTWFRRVRESKRLPRQNPAEKPKNREDPGAIRRRTLLRELRRRSESDTFDGKTLHRGAQTEERRSKEKRFFETDWTKEEAL